MLKLVILITPLITDVHDVTEAWEKLGVPGVTIIESHGLRRLQEHSRGMELLPGMMSLFEIMRDQERNSLTLFSVVNAPLVDAMAEAAQRILGDLNRQDNGIMFVLSVERAIGLDRLGHDA